MVERRRTTRSASMRPRTARRRFPARSPRFEPRLMYERVLSASICIKVILKRVDRIEQHRKFFAECSKTIFDTRRHFGELLPLEDPESHELSQALIQHFCRQALDALDHRTGAIHAAFYEVNDGKRPFAADDILDHRLNVLFACFFLSLNCHNTN